MICHNPSNRLKSLITRKQRIDENTICRSVSPTGYGKLNCLDDKTHLVTPTFQEPVLELQCHAFLRFQKINVMHLATNKKLRRFKRNSLRLLKKIWPLERTM
eukprot:c24723_g1_i7 orf=261-566(-)